MKRHSEHSILNFIWSQINRLWYLAWQQWRLLLLILHIHKPQQERNEDRRPKNYRNYYRPVKWPLFDLLSRLFWRLLPTNNFYRAEHRLCRIVEQRSLSQNQFQAWFRNFGEFPIVDLGQRPRNDFAKFLSRIKLFWWPRFEFDIFILKCSFRVPILENKEVDRQFDELYGEGAAKYMRERRVNKWEWSWTILLYIFLLFQ